MPFGWAAAAATVVGSIISADASSDAASTAAAASQAGTDATVGEQRRQYDLSRSDQAPWLTAGRGAVNQLAAGIAPGGQFASTTPFDFQYSADPGAAFRMSEGVKALDQSAAARGGLLSGATLKGVQRYGQDLASQEYQNAFNRYVTGFNARTGERNALYNRMAGVAGTGQTAAGQIGVQGAQMAGNIGSAYMSNAATQANAALAAAGQRGSAFGGAANTLGQIYGRGGFGRFGGGSNPYDSAQAASGMYGSENVYGYGGGGVSPSGGYDFTGEF